MNFTAFFIKHKNDFSLPIFWCLKSLEDYVSVNHPMKYRFTYSHKNTISIYSNEIGYKVLSITNRKYKFASCQNISDLSIELFNPMHGVNINPNNINPLNLSFVGYNFFLGNSKNIVHTPFISNYNDFANDTKAIFDMHLFLLEYNP